MISRRHFLIITGGAAAAMTHNLFAKDKVPTMLDHLLLGCSDLDEGIAFVEKYTGMRPAMGGVHPGRGTRNALLALGPLRYLEVIAPDPQQGGISWHGPLAGLNELARPTLIWWVAHTSDIVGLTERWKKAGVAFSGPTPGSRARPDGKMLHWQSLAPDDNRGGLLPFFIQWGADTVHPSVDAPTGCTLESFAVVTPEAASLTAEFQKLGIDAAVESGKPAHLRARITGPKGTLALGE